jgi:hypothetical protein
MKNIKIFILVLVFNCSVSQAQVNPYTGPIAFGVYNYFWTITNTFSYPLSFAITASLGVELVNKKRISKLYDELGPLEKTYNDRRKLRLDANMTYTIVGAGFFLRSLVAKLFKLNFSYNVLFVKSKFRYGLTAIGSRMAEISIELESIQNKLSDTFYPLNGDTGYNLTLTLKILKQLIKLDNELIAINFKLDNLSLLYKTFKSR